MTAPAAACASRSARPRIARNRGARRSTCNRLTSHREAERVRFDFFEAIPDVSAEPDPADAHSLPLLRAAVRVLRRLRGLR